MEKKEFTKTSLHNHFGGKSADFARGRVNPSPHFDMILAETKIDNASVNEYQLLALTHHNVFWKSDYLKLNQYIEDKKYKITLIPGAELDIVDDRSGNRQYLHVVILISPSSNLDMFSNSIAEYVTNNGEYAVTIEQLTELAYSNKSILIPHGRKQSKRSALRNIPSFDDILSIRDFFPILIEDKSDAKREILESKIRAHLTLEEFEWLTSSGSISSLDQGNDFSTIKEPTYIWGEPSFDSLFYCAIIGKDRVIRENDIIEKSRYVKTINIKNKGGVLQSTDLNFSHGLNSIIGNSGSGKTLLLNLIKLKLTGKNLTNAVSATNADYSQMYKNSEILIYDNNGVIFKPNEINVFEGENLYKQIISTLNYDKAKLLMDLNAMPSFVQTQKLIDKFNADLNIYISNRIKLNDNLATINKSLVKSFASVEYLRSNENLPDLVEYIMNPKLRTDKQALNTTLNSINDDISKIKFNFDLIKQLLNKYALKKEVKSIIDIRLSLLRKVLLNKIDTKVKIIQLDEKILISNKLSSIVTDYNKTIGERAKVANESKQIISDEFESIINTLKESTFTKVKLSIPTLDEEKLIQSVIKNDELIKLENFSVVKRIYYEDFTTFFDSAIGSAQGKILKSEFSKFKLAPITLFKSETVKDLANVFIEKKYRNSNIYKLIPEALIKFEIMIKNLDDEYQKIDTLSAGQLSKIYINVLIDSKLKAMENNAIVLYDQPDNNLEKTFILETLGRKLAELKKKYQVIITTHEPLLVINSDSNNIIHAANDPIAGVNKITFENLTMYDIGDKKAAIEKIAQLIDGSKRAIQLRNQIYGGSI
ncbi:MAG: hypothetical protein PHF05_06870 [Candidatus Izemoplasmatales bacterium]|nr:hypothetical protein [Candidatus Izemoplasmatales bacterium]